MTDLPPTPAPTGDPEKPQEQPSNGKTDIASLPPDIQQYIKLLRDEAETNRKAKAAAERSAKEAEATKLAEQQEWKKLADSYKADLDKLTPIAEQHEAITAAFNASLDNRLKQIPDDVRAKTVDPVRKTMSPVEFNNWLDANLDLFRPRQSPNLDPGAGGSRSSVPSVYGSVSQADIDMTKATGIPIGQWMKRKFEIQWRKDNPSKDWAEFEKTLPKDDK